MTLDSEEGLRESAQQTVSFRVNTVPPHSVRAIARETTLR